MASYIFKTNFLDTESAATATTGSVNTTYPLSNTVNRNHRTKVYRSQGYWNITASNGVIKFNEGGSTLTATIAAAEYDGRAALHTAIDTALEAAGAGTYTTSIDATSDKMKITQDTGGTFELELTDSGMAGFAALTGWSTSADKTGALNYTADVLRIHEEEFIKWDFGTSVDPKAFALIWSRNSTGKISAGATIKLQGNNADSWTSPAYDQTLTLTDYGIVQATATGLHTAGLRYWRLYIQDVDNVNGYIEIGNLFLGDMFVPTRGAVQFPFGVNYEDLSTQNISEGGQVYVISKEKTEVLNVRWSALTISEREELETFWNDVGFSKAFYIYLDPSAVFSSDASKYFRFVRFRTEPSYSLESPGTFDMDMLLREEL